MRGIHWWPVNSLHKRPQQSPTCDVWVIKHNDKEMCYLRFSSSHHDIVACDYFNRLRHNISLDFGNTIEYEPAWTPWCLCQLVCFCRQGLGLMISKQIFNLKLLTTDDLTEIIVLETRLAALIKGKNDWAYFYNFDTMQPRYPMKEVALCTTLWTKPNITM